MSEVAVPGAFVDENSFKDFNNSFDTDDPLLNGDFEDNYIASIQEITNFMSNTNTNDENDVAEEPETKTTPPPVRVLTKAVDDKQGPVYVEEKPNQQRKSKYYAPVYTVRDRVSGTNSNPTPQGESRKREPRGGREKRPPREDGNTRTRPPRHIHKKDDEPVVEIKKKDKDENSRDTFEQQRKLEEMRRAHEQEQLEREKRLREKEKERQDRDKLQASRIPGERATLYDLMTVVFSASATYEPGEVVLVPRTRGGYSYGRIVQHYVVDRCYADTSVSHPTYHWRIVYPGPGGGGNMFKDLPPAYIGKLVTTFNRDLVMPKDEDGERVIGDKPLGKDLNNAVFLPTSKFTPHQMVLVPRSAGGFTYGRVVKDCTFTCRLDDSCKHEVPAWRVLVSGAGDDAPKVRKDVLAGNIGKLYIPEQLQAAMQAATEAANLPMPNTTTPRRRVSPEARDPLPVPMGLPTVASATLNYAQALQIPTSPIATSPPLVSPIHSARSEPMLDPLDSLTSENSNDENISADGKKQEESGESGAKPLRGVLELPGAIFAKAQKDPRHNRVHDNNNNNNNNINKENANEKPLLVIDGPNVAMKHGKKTFSVKGIMIAVQYYKSRGHDAVAFVPEYFATRKAPQHQLGSSTLKLGDFMNSVGADDLPLLNSMVDQGLIILTPPQDYDDSYSIEYARKHNSCIVTNDRYNDNIDKQPTEREKAQTRKFIRDHCISFTFVRDEFMPNPDFKFPPHS